MLSVPNNKRDLVDFIYPYLDLSKRQLLKLPKEWLQDFYIRSVEYDGGYRFRAYVHMFLGIIVPRIAKLSKDE